MLTKEIKDQLKEGLIKNNHDWEIFYKPYLNGPSIRKNHLE